MKPTTARTFVAYRADPDIANAMHRMKVRDGISANKMIERALNEWLSKQRIGYRMKKEK
jgi:hypothetical protein